MVTFFCFLYFFVQIFNIAVCFLSERKDWLLCLTYAFWAFLFSFRQGDEILHSSGHISDLAEFRIAYHTYTYDRFEVGYQWVMDFCHFVGIDDFRLVLLVIFFLGSIFFYFGTKGFVSNYHIFFAVSMSYPFLLYCTAIRNFLAYSVIFLAMRFLLERHFIYFVLSGVLSICFHNSAVIMFGILFVCYIFDFDILSKFKSILFQHIVFLILFFSVFSYFCVFAFGIQLIVDVFYPLAIEMDLMGIGGRILAYTENVGDKSSIIYFPVFIVNTIVVILVSWLYRKQEQIGMNMSSSFKKVLELSVKVNILALLILPLMAISSVFFRILILPTILNCLLLGMVYDNQISEQSVLNRKNRELFACIGFLLMVAWYCPEIIGQFSMTVIGLILQLTL